MPPCKATNRDGGGCQSPEHLVDPETGYCRAHAPGGRERMAELGRSGAEAMRRKWMAKGLEPGELPELRTPHDAQRALDIVAHAAAEGRLPQRQADATTRAVREWLRAHDAGVVADRQDGPPVQVEEIDVSNLKDEELSALEQLLRRAALECVGPAQR